MPPQRLERKQPGLHYLLHNMITQLREVAHDNVTIIDPERFAAANRYMLLRLERD